MAEQQRKAPGRPAAERYFVQYLSVSAAEGPRIRSCRRLSTRGRRQADESYDTAEDVLVRNRVLLGKLSRELIEFETVDARHLVQLIEEYAVDEIYFEEPSLNGHQMR